MRAYEDAVLARQLGEAEWKTRELEWMLYEKMMEVEILQAAREDGKKQTAPVRRIQTMTGHPVAALCRTLRVSRSTAYRPTHERPRVHRRSDDVQVLKEFRAIALRRDSYGYRRVTARENRLFGHRCNKKRVRRGRRLHSRHIPPTVRRDGLFGTPRSVVG